MTTATVDRPTTTPPRRSARGGALVRRRGYVVVSVLAVLASSARSSDQRSTGSSPTRRRRTDRGRSATHAVPRRDRPAVGLADRPQQARATRLMQQWWSDHGTTADDTAFQAFLEATLPGPPDAARRSAEMGEVERLDRQRTVTGITAATTGGPRQEGRVEAAAHDQAEYLAGSTGDGRKNAVDDMLDDQDGRRRPGDDVPDVRAYVPSPRYGPTTS